MGFRGSIFGVFILILFVVSNVSAAGVFRVQHKFAGRQRSLSSIRAHDGRRHGRFLSGIDLPLAGNHNPSETGLYYTKLGIGSPPKDYYVLVDTGSDYLWVNCIECTQCPTKSKLDIELKLYDPKASATGEVIACDQDICYLMSEFPMCTTDLKCLYAVAYQDDSSTIGYLVRDIIHYDQVSKNIQTTPTNGSIVFGCGAEQSGNLGSSGAALDGILGFGPSNSSMVSQLASSGKVKRMFAHCLGGENGGGIFAIGQVVKPKVKTTPLVPNQPHYNVNMKAIEIGGAVLQLPTDVFKTGDQQGTIIDSGTTLAYLPEVVYKPIMNEILSRHSDLEMHTVEDLFSCFEYSESVDDGFPNVTFHFENSLLLVVYPHDYLFRIQEGVWCIGWQSSGNKSEEGKNMTILGDLVLSNKLIFYDLENQAIGWTEYNCSSSIELQDEPSGAAYLVGAHNLSSAWGLDVGKFLILSLLTAIMHNLIY